MPEPMSLKKRAIKMKHVTFAMVVLVMLIGVTGFLHANTKSGNTSGYELTISSEDKILRTFSLEEIKEMPSICVEKEILSANHEDESGNYKGVPLEYILNMTNKNLLTKYSKFITKAGDSYASALSVEDIEPGNNVVVVYEKDGKSLGHFKKGGKGPMRILIVSDTYGNRCTQYLIGVECR